ncbi:hypothetical protein NP554_06745 [Pseudomonas asiatica]|uniref:Fap system outer membrane protein n=1 Tax=Pseudomonas asiatica TaxID=2219225 RepID=A0A9X4D8A0_9PSED|nr:hypothetical protein [Pseudomonas asiatica]MEE1901947.1 hypothetical protein [Pseudomonas inefficax]MDD2111497.1 hypothetical protein [Pseudomonas asiatica]MEE1906500.1 hypothetical protein [Pseudomonas inefficax]MEE1983874.1 hypothetical protein [Pseudomonas inefficax]WJN49730.1 hypothetical protein QUR91_24345 [Pseudomonas asiatica]
MKNAFWLAIACLTVSLPTQAETFKPIELKDHELATLRGRYVMPGRIVSFGIVMSSTWQNAKGDVIGATSTMQIQQSTIKPQFYVSLIDESGTGTASAGATAPGTGTVTGGAGLNTTEGVTQVVRAAGDNNTAYNNVAINVSKADQAPTAQPHGQALANGQTLTGANGAGALSVSASGVGVQFNISASNNQGSSVQRLAQGGLMQNSTLLGNGNRVNNVTTLNVVMRESVPTAASLNGSLDQLKGLRTFGY